MMLQGVGMPLRPSCRPYCRTDGLHGGREGLLWFDDTCVTGFNAVIGCFFVVFLDDGEVLVFYCLGERSATGFTAKNIDCGLGVYIIWPPYFFALSCTGE